MRLKNEINAKGQVCLQIAHPPIQHLTTYNIEYVHNW